MSSKEAEKQSEKEEGQKGDENDLSSKDLWRIFGIPIKKTKKADHKFKFHQPDTPIINRKDYPTREHFYKKFFASYIDIEGSPYSQRYGSKTCTFVDPETKMQCPGINSTKPKLIRAHFLSHFPTAEYEKFPCPRCNKNYEKYGSLILHGERNMCKIASSYPSLKEFALQVIASHPKQEIDSKTCSNCDRKFKAISYAQEHFLTCIKFTFPCLKDDCKSIFASYNMARRHFEECDGEGKELKPRFTYKIDMPDENDVRTWTESEMMTLIENETIPKIEKVMASHPEGSKGYVGYSSKVKARLCFHFANDLIYNRHEADPILDDNDYILAKFWNKQDAMKFEYLVQHNTSTPEGKFYSRVGHLMNHHNIMKPKKKVDDKKAPHHVYMVVSSAQYYPDKIADTIESDEEIQQDPERASTVSSSIHQKKESIEGKYRSGPSTSTGASTSTKDPQSAARKRQRETSEEEVKQGKMIHKEEATKKDQKKVKISPQKSKSKPAKKTSKKEPKKDDNCKIN